MLVLKFYHHKLIPFWRLSLLILLIIYIRSLGFAQSNQIQDRSIKAPEEIFAAELAATQTNEERRLMIEKRPEMVTKELIKILNTKIGQTLLAQGRYEQAIKLYEFNLKLAERLNDISSMALSFNQLGFSYNGQSRYQEALEYYFKSLKLREQINETKGIIKSLSNIGAVHGEQGNFAVALEYLHKGLKLAEETGDKEAIAIQLNNIGIVYHKQSYYKEAMSCFIRASKMAEPLANNLLKASLSGNVGDVYTSQGNFAQALEHFQRTLTIAETSGYQEIKALSLANIGRVHMYNDNHTQALKFFNKSLKIVEELGLIDQGAYLRKYIGEVYQAQGNYKEALTEFNKALQTMKGIESTDGTALLLNNIGNTYLQMGQYEKAIEVSNQSKTLAIKAGMSDLLWDNYTIIGKAYFGLGKYQNARQAFSEAITIIERLRFQVSGGEREMVSYFQNRLDPYNSMIDLFAAEKNNFQALAYAERERGRVLLDVLGNGRLDITKSMTPDEIKLDKELESEIIMLNTQMLSLRRRNSSNPQELATIQERLDKARLNYEGFHMKLYTVHPELKIHRGQSNPLSLEDLDQLLPDSKTALLEYALNEDKSYLFVITKNEDLKLRIELYQLEVKRAELDQMASIFSEQVGERNPAFSRSAEKLYETLIKPAEEQLKGRKTLCIVPDRNLWYLPFQALKSKDSRYLIEDYAIYYTPSISVLRDITKLRETRDRKNLANTRQETSTLLAFGNPFLNKERVNSRNTVLSGEQINPLPEAEKEIKALRQLYGTNQSQIYLGEMAREDRFKTEASRYRILHIATHGILDNFNPLYSHVMLAQEPDNSLEDGLLEARELMNLDLNAELMILSACQTGRGQVRAGEGVIGLSWAVFVAGCPTTVISQWKVNSASTTELMINFHRYLEPIVQKRSKEMTKAEALRLAALKLLKEPRYKHPYFWAGFVLVGDGR
jgi:CHAT domain-containing protein/tetratricopeptide (TPR) repeat protein